ncbi:unnamed protein product [Caenorhabditis sp. 36 PRJEB53466]|nr:unnamed protein product [Caenorhabditis sp. 36 PRJEB53466]
MIETVGLSHSNESIMSNGPPCSHFPLLKLPDIPLAQIIKFFNAFEVMQLSLCSKLGTRLAKWGIGCSPCFLQISFCAVIKVTVVFRRNYTLSCHIFVVELDHKDAVDFSNGLSAIGGQNVPSGQGIDVKNIPFAILQWDDRLRGLQTVVSHLRDLFNRLILDFFDSLDYKPKHCRLLNDRVNDTDANLLLSRCQPSECFFIDIKTPPTFICETLFNELEPRRVGPNVLRVYHLNCDNCGVSKTIPHSIYGGDDILSRGNVLGTFRQSQRLNDIGGNNCYFHVWPDIIGSTGRL